MVYYINIRIVITAFNTYDNNIPSAEHYNLILEKEK